MERMLVDSGSCLERYFDDMVNGRVHGYIELPVTVANIGEWYFLGRPVAETVLGLNRLEFEKIIYCECGVAFEAGKNTWKIIRDANFFEAERPAKAVFVRSGAEAVKSMLERVTYGKTDALLKEGREEERVCLGSSENDMKKLRLALDKIEAALYFKKYGYERLLIETVEIFPLAVYGIIKKERDIFSGSVLNDLKFRYKTVADMSRNVRLLMEKDGPDNDFYCGVRDLQTAVDHLYGNTRSIPAGFEMNGHVQASLSDVLRFY